MIVAVPALTPVTTPVAFTVATVVSEETHGVVVAAAADPDKAVVEPTHTLKVPVMVGKALMVTVEVV